MNEKFPEKKTAGDIGYAVAKATLGSIPVAGAAASELLGLIVAPPLEKRKAQWFNDIGERLQRLEIVLETLPENDVFIDISIKATEIALKTSEDEKKEALKNAVIHSTNASIDISLQQIFLGYIDTFTVWHIRLLKLFDDPSKQRDKFSTLSMGGLSSILDSVYPELKNERAFYDQIWKDLYLKGLVNAEGLHTTMSESGLLASRTTDMGKKFLAYISEDE